MSVMSKALPVGDVLCLRERRRCGAERAFRRGGHLGLSYEAQFPAPWPISVH